VCDCEKPTINGDPKVYPMSPPTLTGTDKLLYDLPGRCGRGIDSHAYHFRIVDCGYGSVRLLVRHGGGEQVFDIGRCHSGHRHWVYSAIVCLSNDEDRYWFCQTLYHMLDEVGREARDTERLRWQTAASQGTLKIRSRRKQKYAFIEGGAT